MLIFIGKLTQCSQISTMHVPGFLHHFVLAKLAISSIETKENFTKHSRRSRLSLKANSSVWGGGGGGCFLTNLMKCCRKKQYNRCVGVCIFFLSTTWGVRLISGMGDRWRCQPPTNPRGIIPNLPRCTPLSDTSSRIHLCLSFWANCIRR